MAKPTNTIKGFIRLTVKQANDTEMLISLRTISTVRAGYESTVINVTNSPFARGSQELNVSERYEEVIQRINDAS